LPGKGPFRPAENNRAAAARRARGLSLETRQLPEYEDYLAERASPKPSIYFLFFNNIEIYFFIPAINPTKTLSAPTWRSPICS
jgi:hypothetical protein